MNEIEQEKKFSASLSVFRDIPSRSMDGIELCPLNGGIFIASIEFGNYFIWEARNESLDGLLNEVEKMQREFNESVKLLKDNIKSIRKKG